MADATSLRRPQPKPADSARSGRNGARSRGFRLSLATVLVGIAILTAIGSLYVYMAGTRARIERLADLAERRRQVLISEIASLQSQIAERESYMKLRPVVHGWGMEDLRPEDCNYFLVPPDAGLSQVSEARAWTNVPAVSDAGEDRSP